MAAAHPFTFFMLPNAQIRAFGIFSGQDYPACIAFRRDGPEWEAKQFSKKCRPAVHALHFSFCKIAQSGSRALAIFLNEKCRLRGTF